MVQGRWKIAGRFIFLAVAIVLTWRWLAARPRPPVSRVTPAPNAARSPTPTALPGLAVAPSPSPTVPVQAAANLAAMTAQELKRRARYPHSSQPLHANAEDPILRDRQVSANRFPGPNGAEPVLVLFAEQTSFEHPESVTLHAHLIAADAHVPAQSIEGEVVDAHGQPVARLTYAARGSDYVAHLADSPDDRLAGGAYLVRVRAVTVSGEERTGASGFLYSRPSAQPTGRYRDALVDGSLEISAEVQVAEAGRFHLEGTLYTRDGAPLAWAQNALTLSPGAQWIPLSFFGLILHERGADGPYVLRYAALSTVTGMPNAKNRLVENAHMTNPYRAADFADQPYDDPELLDAAGRMESGGAPAADTNTRRRDP